MIQMILPEPLSRNKMLTITVKETSNQLDLKNPAIYDPNDITQDYHQGTKY